MDQQEKSRRKGRWPHAERIKLSKLPNIYDNTHVRLPLPATMGGLWGIYGFKRSAVLHDLMRATKPETQEMLRELRSVLKSRFFGVTAIREECYIDWMSGGLPLPLARRAIWLQWCLICRPGSLRTCLDLATWGRWSKKGNHGRGGTCDPATAGKYRDKMRVKEWTGPEDDDGPEPEYQI